jgi:glycosyltransferase involved in cell wall biosynthesis
MPSVSVIIATRDRPQFLWRSVESARSAGDDVEIVVVDDASSHETTQLCKAMPGIKYVRAERQQGLGGARNIGLIASRGEFVTFLDDDDLRLRHSLRAQVDLLKQNKSAALIYAQAIVEGSAGEFIRTYPRQCPSGDLFWMLVARNFIPCASVVFRRSCLSQVGLLEDCSDAIEDWDLWVRIAEIDSIIGLAAPVVVYRQSTPVSGQLSSQATEIVEAGIAHFREWMSSPRALAASPEMRREAWAKFSENMAEHILWETVRSLSYGKVLQSVDNVSVLARLYPFAISRIVKRRLLSHGRSTFGAEQN